jgi:hypothetical protein
MKCTRMFWLVVLLACTLMTLTSRESAARDVVAFWGFADDYDFNTNPNYQDFAADVDATDSGDANLQAYLGVADQLDNNGGAGFVTYTSPTSGIFYDFTRTLKYDDLKGSGSNFAIGGSDTFLIDKNDGGGPSLGNFGNDALMYITLDGAGYRDFELRFDIEGDPASLPATFDIFYRVDGSSGTWYRDASQNNIPLSFVDYDPVDPENQYADSGMIAMSALLDNASSIEIIINDFAELGNGEMEIDNVEITAAAVPEPTSLMLLASGALLICCRRRCAAI